MLAQSALVAALGAGSAMAGLVSRATPKTSVITFDFPVARGSDFTTNDQSPCGGLAAGTPQNYPMNGGDVAYTLVKDMENVSVRYAKLADSGDAANFKDLLPNVTHIYVGSSCNNGGNFADLGFSVGDELTLQVIGHGGPNALDFYNCADIKLVDASSFTTTANYTCVNYVKTTKTGGPSGGNTDTPDASTASNDGLSLAAAGGLGAGVTLGVIAAAVAGLFFAGVWSFGKKQKTSQHIVSDDKSSMTSIGKPARV